MADKDWQSGKSFSKTNLHMLKSQLLADVTFIVGEQREKTLAHKFILVSRSCVFEAMFCGPMAEKNIVEIPDVESKIFEDFLRYIYTDDVILRPDTVLPLLYVAKKYSVKGLEKKCVQFCDSTLSPENACTVLQQACIFDEELLKARALGMIAENAIFCLASEGFCELGKHCLDLVLESDELRVQEIDVYQAAINWAKAECGHQEREVTGEEIRNVLGQSLNQIRFPLIAEENLATNVVPERILTDTQLVSLFVRYTITDAPSGQFNARRRYGNMLTLNRSLNIHHKYQDSNRKDALRISCDKSVSLQAIYVYGGDMEQSFNLKVRLEISRKETVIREQTKELMVTKNETVYRISVCAPVEIISGCDVSVRVICEGPIRWL